KNILLPKSAIQQQAIKFYSGSCASSVKFFSSDKKFYRSKQKYDEYRQSNIGGFYKLLGRSKPCGVEQPEFKFFGAQCHQSRIIAKLVHTVHQKLFVAIKLSCIFIKSQRVNCIISSAVIVLYHITISNYNHFGGYAFFFETNSRVG